MGIDPKLTTAYHPQTDGQTERFNRTLMSMIRCFVNHRQSDWEEVLELVCFAYRSSVHSSTLETPYFLMHGHHPNLLIDRFLDTRIIKSVTPNDYRSQLMERMNVAFRLAKENLGEARENMKRQYNKRAKDVNYQIGDKVLLDIKVLQPDQNKKMTSKYEGPYRILKTFDNGTVTIITSNNKEKHVHVNRLKPLFETMLWQDEPMEPFQDITITKTLKKQSKNSTETIITPIDEPIQRNSSSFRNPLKEKTTSLADIQQVPENTLPSTEERTREEIPKNQSTLSSRPK